MRLLKPLACTLLLAALAAGQTSSNANPTGASQQPNQPPQSPLQESQNPIQDSTKRPDSENKPAQSSFDVSNVSQGGAQDQHLGEVRLMTRYTQLNGDTTRSFRVEGENNLGEFNYYLDHGFSGARRIQFLGMYRATDDQSIDPEHQSMQRVYLRLYGPKDEYIIGDSLVSFSRLTFNQNVKGVNMNWRLADDWKLSVVGGIFVDRWGSLYKDLLGRPYTAAVSGVRVEHKLWRNSQVGFNFASSDDLVDSLPAQLPGTPPLPASNRIGSVDSRFRVGKLNVDSEFAYSFTNFDVRAASCPTSGFVPLLFPGAPPVCDSRIPTPGIGTQGDWGGRVEGSYKWKKFTFRSSYVRYQPNFTSINARQIPDLQDVIFRVTYELTSWLTLDGTGRRSNNDLKDQLPFETRLWGPEGRLTFHDLSFYPRAVFEVGYRHRDVQGYTKDPGTLCAPAPAPASTRCIDRFIRIPFAEVTIPYHTTFFTAGMEYRHAMDFIDPSQISNTPRGYVSVRGIYDIGGWHINPTFRYEIEMETHKPRLNNPVFPLFLQLLEDTDYNRLGTGALFVEAPRWFIAELAYRDSNAQIFGPAGFNRPSYKAALTYKIRNDENLELIFAFERYNNYYKTSPDFDERVMGVTLLYKFGNRR